MIATCDNVVELSIDGKIVLVNKEWSEPVTKDVDIDGAAVYRIALNLPARPKP